MTERKSAQKDIGKAQNDISKDHYGGAPVLAKEPNMVESAGIESNYLYCVAHAGEHHSLGLIGLDGREVYTIPYLDICAVVHDCPAEPYKSHNRKKLEEWVTTHQLVVDTAWNRWGAVLPSGFSTILQGAPGTDAAQCVVSWLKRDYPRLAAKINAVQEKAEYGVQIFWDPKIIAKSMAAASLEIRLLEEGIRSKSRGLAYMYRQKLENLLKKEMEAQADQYFKQCYGRIRKHVDDVRVEKVKKQEADLQMILNLSCLVPQDMYLELGEELDGINHMEGLSVRFTGPWPPYSFVG